MRKIISLLIIVSFNSFAGLPPTTMYGDQSASKITTINHVLPNYQSTQLAGVSSRIETGNSNILKNPSFEASNTATDNSTWVDINATKTINTTSVVDGKNSLDMTLGSAVLSTYQLSTINAAAIAGNQMMASIYVKTTLSDVSVCSMINSAEDKCAAVASNGSWVLVQIPFIAGSTNNGIKVKTTSSTTGDVYLDNAFVGLSSPFQNVNGAQLLGTVTITGCAAAWNGSSTTMASFSVQTGCVYTTTGQALAPSTMLPAIKFASLQAGDYRLEYEGLLNSSVASAVASSYQFSDGTNTAREISSILNNAYAGSPGISQTMSYSSAQSNVTFEIKYKTDSGNTSLSGITSRPGVIKVWYFPPQSKIYSAPINQYAATNTFSAQISSSGVVSNQNIPWINGSCSVSTSVYTCTLLTILKDGTSPLLNQMNCTITNTLNNPITANIGSGHSATQVQYVTVQANTNTSSAQAVHISCTKAGTDFTAPTLITGSFSGVPTVPGLMGAVDHFSVSYGTTNATTVCSASPCSYLDQIGNAVSSVTWNSAGNYNLNFVKTYSKMKCTMNQNIASNAYGWNTPISCSNCNTVNFLTYNSGGTSGQNTVGTITCDGQL